MEAIIGILVAGLVLGILVTVIKGVSLRMTKAKLLNDKLPFTVYATISTAEEAEYTVRCALERIRWLDLYGMCRVVCLNPTKNPEIDAIIVRLAEKYPFAEIGAFQKGTDVL